MNQSESSLHQIKPGDKIDITDIYVTDGDSIEAKLPSGERYKIRLFGIDAPELGQHFRNEARDHLKSMVRLPAVLYVKDFDHHGRVVGEVYFGTEQNSSVNLRMIRGGYAHNYPYSGELEGAEAAEAEAKDKSLGIWSTSSRYVKPEEYRTKSKAQRQAKIREQKEGNKQRRKAWIMKEARTRAHTRQLQSAQVSTEHTRDGKDATPRHLPDTAKRFPHPTQKTPEDSQTKSPEVRERSKGCLVSALPISALVVLATALTWLILSVWN